MRTRLFRRGRRAMIAMAALAFIFAVLIVPAGAEEQTARSTFTDDMSPHAILMASENFIAPSGSIEYIHIQDDNMVSHTKDGALRYRLHAETVTREIWEDGFSIAWHRRVVEESSGDFGNRTTVRESCLKDGYIYVNEPTGKWKYATAPVPYQGVGEVEDYLVFVFPENMIASQSRHGNRLKFVLDPEAINARQEETGRLQRYQSANMEAELDEDGEIRHELAVAAYTQKEESLTETGSRNEMRVSKTGGVTITYPPDLDTYPEKENPFGENVGEGEE